MLQIIISAVFKILNFLSVTFLGPIFTAISSILPGLTDFFSHFLTFLNYGLNYTEFFIKLLMIPTAPLVVVVGLFVGIFAFNITLRVVGLTLAIYHYFKP